MATRHMITARLLGGSAFGAVLLAGVAWLLRVAPPAVHEVDPGCLIATPGVAVVFGVALAIGFATWWSARHVLRIGSAERWLTYSIVLPSCALAWLLPYCFVPADILMLWGDSMTNVWARLIFNLVPNAVLVGATALRGYRLVSRQPAARPLLIYGLAAMSPMLASPNPWILMWSGVMFLPVIPMLYAMAPIALRLRRALDQATDELAPARAVERTTPRT